MSNFTITSRDLAKFCKRSHFYVCEACHSQILNDLCKNTIPFQQGGKTDFYIISERDSYSLMGFINPDLLGELHDMWQERRSSPIITISGHGEGKHSRAESVSVHLHPNKVAAEVFIRDEENLHGKHWTVVQIVDNGEEIEITSPY